MDDFMNILQAAFAIIWPILIVILLVLLILVLYKTYKILVKTNEMMDEVEDKMHSFDFIFNILDNVNMAISKVNFLKKLTKKRR